MTLAAVPDSPGLKGFLKSFFIVHYGAMPWSVGPPAVLSFGLAKLYSQQWYSVAWVLAFLALPYTPLWKMLPWSRIHQWMMMHCPSSRAFAATSFQVDPKHPPNFDEAEKHPVLLAYSPHGVFCHAFSGSHGVLHPGLAEKGVKFLLAGPLFHAPVFRHLVVALGNIRSASRASVVACMQQRKHLALLPGGIEEASLAQPGREAVFIRKRLGFIKLALQHGYTIHPVYSFGEASSYACLVPSWIPNSLRWALARRGIPVVAPLGRWWAPLMPQKGAELHTYVGRPVVCPRTSESDLTPALLEATHKRYVAELLRLFDEHKGKHGCEKAPLELY